MFKDVTDLLCCERRYRADALISYIGSNGVHQLTYRARNYMRAGLSTIVIIIIIIAMTVFMVLSS